SRFPIAVDLDFGHTDPMFCLPWGVRARLEAGDEVRISLLEPAVSER
ncbi:MAG: muramoyltetrapeptide carboxypeptidase, partial [Gaiellaceae bacterium]|nr:muramoyltetrapeptide carboxypeptidase [Gaiellaceae bacterium]